MATGRSTKLVGQAGEFIVAGELARRGYISTTFTGNVPHYDIVASSDDGRHLSVQVKTALAGSWHLQITQYCDITFDGPRQVLGPVKGAPVLDLVSVFVVLAGQGQDRFYVLRWDELRDLVVADYAQWMEERGWVRPKNPKSLLSVRIPRQAEHRFHAKPNTDSTASRTPIPRQAEHRFHGKANTF